MKGIFKLKPSLSKYTGIYDADLVIRYLMTINNDTAKLKEFSQKLLMLLLLITSQRSQSMASIDIRTIHECETLGVIDIFIPDVLKTTKPGRHLLPMRLQIYTPDPNICPVATLKLYLAKTKSIRTDNQLFVSYIQPHRGVKSTTLSRWAKETLKAAGVDITTFSAHSTRAASTSKMMAMNISTEDIRKVGIVDIRSVL